VNISVIGTGYVGLVVGACLAKTGNDVICATRTWKIEGLKKTYPIFELASTRWSNATSSRDG
jgi:UDPglucose 6-dehydrogenase